ncbi:MAG: hypothetical protein ACFFD2_17310 [Promethearchaeota archaeon]
MENLKSFNIKERVALFPFLSNFPFLLDLPLDWNEKMTLFLILFSAGVLCTVCAILLAVYLLKSDRFLSKSKKEEEKALSYPSFEELEEESRLSKTKSKIRAFFGRIKGVFKRSKDDSKFLEIESMKVTDDSPSELSEEEPSSPDEDSPP